MAAGSGGEGTIFRWLQIFEAFHPHLNRVWESGGAQQPSSFRRVPGAAASATPTPPMRAPVHSHWDVDKGLGPESKGSSLDKILVTELLGVFAVKSELCMRPAFFVTPSWP